MLLFEYESFPGVNTLGLHSNRVNECNGEWVLKKSVIQNIVSAASRRLLSSSSLGSTKWWLVGPVLSVG